MGPVRSPVHRKMAPNSSPAPNELAVQGRWRALGPMCSSANQALRLFSARHTKIDFGVQTVEITIAADGLTRTTGFPTLGNPA